MAERKVGIWLVGACGNVATTATLGLLALQKNLVPPVGLVTELADFASLPLAAWQSWRIGGHDIRQPRMLDTAERLANENVVPRQVLEACREELASVQQQVRPGTAYHAGDAIRQLAEVPLLEDQHRTPRAIIANLQSDFQAFIERHDLETLVVVNVASTEPVFTNSSPAGWSEFDAALSNAAVPLPASTLYAVAALELRLPFVNFTPSTGATLAAVEELACEKKICHAGQDGKTGETLMKTVLAPMFAKRHLEVLSWVGHNIFGNLDGKVLDNPENRATKVATKDRVLGGTLGYDPQTLVSIEYIQSLGDWKTAWDHIHFRGFLGTLMALQFTWQGSDSALAAPLVLDLARLVDLAARSGQVGCVTPLAPFFKRPLGTTEHDFAAQHQALLEWVQKLSTAQVANE